jgi:predicted dithiol-disulfide oxidoreductase (DUF899 family)
MLPVTASREEWLAARKELLIQEKQLTRARDDVSQARRELPMVEVEENYAFEGPGGSRTLLDLFEGRRQLIVHQPVQAMQDRERVLVAPDRAVAQRRRRQRRGVTSRPSLATGEHLRLEQLPH